MSHTECFVSPPAMELSLNLLFVYRNRSITLTSQNKVCLRFTAKNLCANELLINV